MIKGHIPNRASYGNINASKFRTQTSLLLASVSHPTPMKVAIAR
jgi:hypothetical protein